MSALRNFEIIGPENANTLGGKSELVANTLGGKATENAENPVREANAIRCWLQGKSEHTVRAYRRHLRDFLRIAGAESIAAACRDYSAGSAAIRAFESVTEDLGWQSRNQRYAALRTLLSLSEREGVYREQLSHLVPVSRMTREEIQAAPPLPLAVSWQDCLRAIATEPDDRNRLIMRALLNTGLRGFELAGARRSNLYPCTTENGTLTGMLWVVGKGNKGRWITLRRELHEELQRWLVRSAPQGYPTLFDVGEKHISRICANTWKRAGIDGGKVGTGSHLLRHLYTTHALRFAENRAVSATLGHASIRTTANYDQRVPDPPTDHLPWL